MKISFKARRPQRLGAIAATLLIVTFGLPVCCHAWSAGGHMVAAGIAYRQLPASTQRGLTALLKQHPDAAGWLAAYRPGSDPEQSMYLFMRAGLWPDEIRRKGNANDHPHWHYVNYPLTAPFRVVPDDVARPAPNDDILFGIQRSEAGLANRRNSAALRAISLSLLIHLVADLHQPLHCSALINPPQYKAPLGDKGGNNFYIRPARAAVKLHAFWDGLLGTRKDARRAYHTALQLDRQYPRDALSELSATTPTAWSLESCRAALQYGYLFGRLQGGRRKEDAGTVDVSYRTDAKNVARRRVTLAGYRLADEIVRVLR